MSHLRVSRLIAIVSAADRGLRVRHEPVGHRLLRSRRRRRDGLRGRRGRRHHTPRGLWNLRPPRMRQPRVPGALLRERQHDAHRPGVRPGRQSALQRRGLRPELDRTGELQPIPIGVQSANSCSCKFALVLRGAASGRAHRRIREVHAHQRAGGQEHPARRPDRQVGAKEITVPTVAQCRRPERGKTTLPKSSLTAPTPSIRIAGLTGRAERSECLLTRVGVDERLLHGQMQNGPVSTSSREGAGRGATGRRRGPRLLRPRSAAARATS